MTSGTAAVGLRAFAGPKHALYFMYFICTFTGARQHSNIEETEACIIETSQPQQGM
jgi:hypothetical protein